MKKIPLLLGMLSAMCFFSCESSNSRNSISQDNHLKIDVNNVSPFNNGVFEGWGTSLCWWANRLGGNDIITDKAIDLFFSKDGLGLNIIRYNIGGGDNPSHFHIKRSDSAMPGFLVYSDKTGKFEYDWTMDLRQRNVLKKVAATIPDDEIILEFFSNSPPYFMTKSGCSSGSFLGFTDNLRDDMYEAFADYLAEVTFNLQQIDGVKVNSLEPMNEPVSVSWKKYSHQQEGCHVSRGKNQSRLIELTRDALDHKGLTSVIVSACDESSVGMQARSFNALNDKAKAIVKRINTHTYFGNEYKKLFDAAMNSNKNLWISETDAPVVVGKNCGQMGPALAFAEKIMKDLTSLQPSAWLIWQCIGGYVSDEPFNGCKDSKKVPGFYKPFWGLAVADFNTDSIVLSKKYYVFAQFTKFIRPGSRIIYTGRDDVIASYSLENKQVSIVCLNTSETEKQFALDLSSFGNAFNSANVYRTSGLDLDTGENCQAVTDVVFQNGEDNYSVTLSPYSVTTFIFDGL